MGIKHTDIKEFGELLKNSEHPIKTSILLRNVMISNTGFSVYIMGNGGGEDAFIVPNSLRQTVINPRTKGQSLMVVEVRKVA